MEILLVIDMQNDFIDGALGTPEAQAIVQNVVGKVKSHKGKVIFTRDTHGDDYLSTAEGKKLPVPHCIQGTQGWQIADALQPYCTQPAVDKPTFGSITLVQKLIEMHQVEPITCIMLVGLCTDICVISNAMLCKAALPEVPICVDSRCCAGVTPATHQIALDAMKMCQIEIV